MLSERKESILKLIVEEYVRTIKPVGSKNLCDVLNCSSATVRNEMQELEETVADDNEVVEVKEVEETRTTKKKTETRAALVKFLQGKKLSKEERDVLVETTTPGEDQNSVAVIIPQDIYTEINELKRQYKPLKQFVDVQATSTTSGSFVYENGDTIEPFVDITEATEIGELMSPTLKQQKFAITDKGGILPISNTLLADEKGGLVKYINKWLARKSVVTDNRKILSILKRKFGAKIRG